MRKLLYLVAFSVLGVPAVAADQKVPPTPQIQRGQDLFTNSQKGAACKTCPPASGTGSRPSAASP